MKAIDIAPARCSISLRSWLNSWARRLSAGLGLLLLLQGGAMAQSASQIPDQISSGSLWNEWLLNRPLTAYLKAHPERALPPSSEFQPENLRGYHAQWRIVDGRLEVYKVTVFQRAPKEQYSRDINMLSHLFGVSTPVLADWYTGALVVQLNKHESTGTKTRYQVIPVLKGMTSAPIAFDEAAFAEYRKKKFEAYKKTATYRLRHSEFFSIDPKYSVNKVDEFLFNTDHDSYLLTPDDTATPG